MLQKVKDWLVNPKRNYQAGVAIFEQLAESGIRKKYLEFFKNQDKPAVSSMAFTMLINKVSDIHRNLRISATSNKPTPTATSEEAQKKVITKVDFSEINRDELPEDLQADYDHLVEIRPLQAKYHADLKNASLSEDERFESATNLVALEEERKAIWLKFEVHFNAKISATVPEEEKQENDFKRGFDAAKKIAKLQENIANCKVTEAKKGGKESIRTNAKTRRENYEKKLSEILSELSE